MDGAAGALVEQGVEENVVNERLDAIGERLDRVLRGPDAIEAQLLFRVARPLFAIAGWRANMRSSALSTLVGLLQSADGAPERPTSDPAAAKAALEGAIRELEANVVAIERVAIVRKRAPVAHALWLRRVHGVIALAGAAIEMGAEDDATRRSVAKTDASALLPPLIPVRRGASSLEVPTVDDPEIEEARRRDLGELVPDDISSSNLVDLELAAIDHLFAAARAETLVLGRKRRLLIAARQRLLEASAALPLDREGVRARTRYIAREVTRIDRLEAAGLSADVSLVHQARQALVRRDTSRLFASLSALDANALSAADHDVSARTGRALSEICAGEERGADAAMASLQRSATEMLGAIARDVASAVDDARGAAQERLVMGGVPSERDAAKSFLEYLPQGAGAAILSAATLADGFFEVGGALAAVRVEEEERILRTVRHPTQDLVLMPAEDVQDLRDAVIGDPRSLLLDLATGRLFARRFVREEVRRRSRVVLHGEVRVYVLDGSGSMRGPRARVRDAILVAELSTLIRRLESPNKTRCILFYRYFDAELGLVSRVQTVRAARDAIRDIVGTERSGGTDIQKALLASIEQIAEARADDPDLARAQIVLVTDGEAAVDESMIVSARSAIQGLPIGISVIALGQENPALRGLVARQRARGEAAFYHFLDDDELAAIADGSLTGDIAIHPPDRWKELEKDPQALVRALDDEVGGLLDELEALDRERDVSALERLEEEAQARREVGLDEGEEGADAAEAAHGERARVEALRKDRVALGARYARWFPEPRGPSSEDAPLPKPGTRERDDIDATCCALASVAEVVALLGGSPIARQADAIDLLERLLPDARLSPARYRAVLREFPHAVGSSLRALRDAVAGHEQGR